MKSLDRMNEPVICSECGENMNRLISGGSTIVFGEQTFDHITDTPLTFTSKRALLEACEKHNCYSVGYG